MSNIKKYSYITFKSEYKKQLNKKYYIKNKKYYTLTYK